MRSRTSRRPLQPLCSIPEYIKNRNPRSGFYAHNPDNSQGGGTLSTALGLPAAANRPPRKKFDHRNRVVGGPPSSRTELSQNRRASHRSPLEHRSGLEP